MQVRLQPKGMPDALHRRGRYASVPTHLAHASPEVGSEIGSDTIEALGWFMAETADIAAALLVLTRACRHYTADYATAKAEPAPQAKF